MTGSFASFNTALTALRYNRVVMDVASGNIANVSTQGYARRRVEGEVVGAPAQPAMWSRYEGAGEGVRVADLNRLTDQFLDTRARYEHGANSYLGVRQSVLERFETGVGEPGENGVAAALNEFVAGWHDLANAPGGDAARSQVLGRAAGLVEAINIQARNVAQEAIGQRTSMESLVAEVNTVASDLAASNKSVAAAGFNGTDANALKDQRDLLAMRLAELTGGVATQRPDGGLDVTVNGTSLVDGYQAGRLVVTTGATGGPVTFAITSASGTQPVAAGMRGEIGATADLLTVTLPAYAAGLDAVAQQLADDMNAQHTQGFDRSGAPGQALFTYDAANPSGSLRLAFTDPALVAAASVPGGGLDGENADAMAGSTRAGDAYQRLVNGLGTEVASTKRLAANQAALTGQVDGSREQLSGVNLDEEMVTMMSAQRAYEAAARVMSTLDSVLDTLINRTGLVGR